MASDFSTAATTSDTDITDRFDLDTGQRANFYDLGRLVRKVGKPAPTGRLLINFDYFEHGSGDFFSVDSYSGFDYGSIPSYTSDVSGEKFELRDVLDFRPRVDNASTIDSGAQDRSFDGTGASTIDFAKFNSDITADLEYYLSRRDKLFMTSTGEFKLVQGAPDLEPVKPKGVEDAMLLYELFLPAYTFKTTDVRVRPIENKRFTMRDIGRLEKRIENVEYYTQLSLLESEAKNMQIQDAEGFDRFKNGIIVDNFTGHGIGDVSDNDYSVSMDMGQGELRPAFHQDNIGLLESDSSLENSTAMTDTIRSTNGYQKTGDVLTLPYTSVSYQDQPYASKTLNLQPYDVLDYVGTVTLSPEIDEWFETETKPDLLVELPGTFDTLTELASQGVLDLNLGTVWNNWNTDWTGDVEIVNRRNDVDVQGNEQITTVIGETEQRVGLVRSGIRTGLVPNTVRNNLGDRIVNIAFAQFIRPKTITFTAKDMKPDTRIFPFFDGVDVSTNVTPTGSSAGAALTTDSTGTASGTFVIPDPTNTANPKFRTGKRVFRLTSSSTNTLTGDVFTSAEADYTAKGFIQQVESTVVSTREAQVERESVNQTDTITVFDEVILDRRVDTIQPPRRPDPIAQTFMVDDKDGIFLTSVDLFFSSKDAVKPVQVQIRTVEQGYPTTKILPFGQVFVESSDVNTSTDGTSATTFTFPSPVFLKEGTEYCFVAKCNSPNYTVYTARLGDKTLDGNRLISRQPHFGGLFKSQNARTWTAEQNEDIKFILKRAKFTTDTTGSIHLVNDVMPTKTLKQNPIETNSTAGSGTTFGSNPAIIKVNHPNHGMHSTSNNVTIAGLASGDYNGIDASNINGTYTTIGNITLDSYTITAQSSDVATSTGDVGGTSVTATRNMLFDVIQPVIGTMQPPGTTITSSMRNTTGKTLEGSETEFSLDTAAKAKSVNLNIDFYKTAPSMVASAINETNEMSGSKSFALTISMSTPKDNISPVIDIQRLSLFLIQNRMFSPTSGTTVDFVAETTNTGGSAPAKYITKPVLLTNESTALDVRLTASVQSTSAVKVFYRTTNVDDVRKLGDVAWRAFNTDGTADVAVDPSRDDNDFKEQKFTVSGLEPFSAFSLKIVLTGTVSSYPPLIRDMRGIALAV